MPINPCNTTLHLLSALAHASEAGVIVLDSTLQIVLWNDWMAGASWIPSERVLGTTLEAVFPASVPALVQQAIQRTLQHGMATRLSQALHEAPFPLYRTLAERREGVRMQQMVSIKPLELLAGGRYCLIQITDVTETARREQLLRQQARTMEELAEECHQSEIRLRAMLESVLDGILIVNEHGRVETCNPAAAQVFGWGAEEIMGQPLHTFVPDLKDHTAMALGKRGEMTGQRQDGSTFPVEIALSAMSPDQRCLSLAIVRDISERKQAEADLIEAREAARLAAHVKSVLLANMSHEIRSPINGVLDRLDLLMHTALTPEQQHYVEAARGSGGELLTLLNDIVDLSKIEAGQLVLEQIPFDVRLVVEDVVDLLAEQAYGKGVELACLIAPEVPRSVCGDPTRLRQVLTNLVSNAVKVTDHGEVVIRVRQAEMAADTGTLLFEVCDTGTGISPAAQLHTLDASTQDDDATMRPPGGTGLGLTIARHLVACMGGTIAMASVPAQGNTFRFTIQVENAQMLPAVGPTGTLTGKRILVVENHPTSRQVLQSLLASWDVQHGSVATAGEALRELCTAMVTARPYDLVLLDACLSDMDSLQLARTIKAISALAQVRLILLTAIGQRGDGEAARAAGVDAYLTRPIRRTQLHDCLLTVLGFKASETGHLVTCHTLKEVQARQRKSILLAEDNPVNQKVALGFLKKLGYRTDVVANGREAVEALLRQPYDLVLMDCQMPQLDGFAATAEIRQREGDRHHTLIVAMTADAMQGDRERCLTAGMDDYISKPVTLEVLRDTLACWLSEDDAAAVASPEVGLASATPGDPGGPPVALQTIAALRELLEEAFPETIAVFLHDTSAYLQELRAAAARHDTVALIYVAHTLKGSSGNLGAIRLSNLCQQMMDVSQHNGWSEVTPYLEHVEAEFRRVRAALEALCHVDTGLQSVSRVV